MTDRNKQQNMQADRATATTRNNRADGSEAQTYLNHGVESLVAMDNPDDSQLGASRQQTKGPGR